jgi:hypothetical protein
VADFFAEYVNVQFLSLDAAIYGDKPIIVQFAESYA